jgi:hypothetical protein
VELATGFDLAATLRPQEEAENKLWQYTSAGAPAYQVVLMAAVRNFTRPHRDAADLLNATVALDNQKVAFDQSRLRELAFGQPYAGHVIRV